MSKPSALRAPPTNRLLAALPKDEYRQVLPDLKPFRLNFGEVIYEPGDAIRHVYFPTSGIISLLAEIEDRATLEVGIVGREGMVGLPAFMGVKDSRNRAIVQGEGVALRMNVKAFRNECNNGGSFPRLLRRYTHSRLTQIAQGAACNQFHAIDARLARWLLMTRDRMGSDEFLLTQEFVSNMLGVRREAVNKAAGELQQQRLITYVRGTLTILKPMSLANIACKCYQIIKKEYAGAFQ